MFNNVLLLSQSPHAPRCPKISLSRFPLSASLMVLCPVWAVLGSKLNARLSQAVTHRIRIQQHIHKNSWTLGTRHCGQRCGEPTSGQRRVPPADGTYPPLWSRIPCHASLFESRDRELCRECRTLVLRKPKQKGFTSPRLYGYIMVYHGISVCLIWTLGKVIHSTGCKQRTFAVAQRGKHTHRHPCNENSCDEEVSASPHWKPLEDQYTKHDFRNRPGNKRTWPHAANKTSPEKMMQILPGYSETTVLEPTAPLSATWNKNPRVPSNSGLVLTL